MEIFRIFCSTDIVGSGIFSCSTNVPSIQKQIQSNLSAVYEVIIPLNAVGGKIKRFGLNVTDINNRALKAAPYRLELTPGIAGGTDSSKLAVVNCE